MSLDAALCRKALDGGCAEEAVDAGNVLDNVGCVLRLGDGAAVADNHGLRVDVVNCLNDALDDLNTIVEGARGFCADGAARGEAHVGNDDIGACLGHVNGLLLIEYVGAGEHIELMRLGDHLDLKVVAHAGFFQVLAEHAVDQANRGKVLNAVEALLLQVFQVLFHYAERVGAAYAGKHGGVLNNRKNLYAHLHNDLVCVAVGKEARQRAAACHAETTGVVDNEDVGSASLGGLSGNAGTGAYAEQDFALCALFLEAGHDLFAGLVKHVASFLFQGACPVDKRLLRLLRPSFTQKASIAKCQVPEFLRLA